MADFNDRQPMLEGILRPDELLLLAELADDSRNPYSELAMTSVMEGDAASHLDSPTEVS